jgi:hypothetical protein
MEEKEKLKNAVFWDVTSKQRFLQEPHGIISKKTAFLIVTALKTSNLTERKIGRSSQMVA